MTAGLHVDARVDRGDFAVEVDLHVAPGQFLAVVGPNGAGKSSLLRAVAGLHAVTAGTVRIGDLVLDDAHADVFVPPERRPVALTFQDHRLFPHLSAADNVAFSYRARGVDRRRANALAHDQLARVGLEGRALTRAADLSGGESQRVAVARALATEPGVLLLDEPMAALDARTRLTLRATLRDHLADFAGPVLLVTHDAVDALVLADRIVVLEDGRVSQDGPPAELARRPRTDYVARLVGLNLYAGTSLDSHTVALEQGGVLVVADPLARGPVHVAVRPSTITVHTESPTHASPRNVWPGVLRELEVVGDRVRAVVTGPPDAIVDLTPAAVADLELRPGREVWLSAKATDIEAYAG